MTEVVSVLAGGGRAGRTQIDDGRAPGHPAGSILFGDGVGMRASRFGRQVPDLQAARVASSTLGNGRNIHREANRLIASNARCRSRDGRAAVANALKSASNL